MATLEDSNSTSLAEQLMARHQISSADSSTQESGSLNGDASSTPINGTETHDAEQNGFSNGGSSATDSTLDSEATGSPADPETTLENDAEENPALTKATTTAAAAAASQTKIKSNKIDVSSFDAFPTLGALGKSSPSPSAGAWGKHPTLKPVKASAVANSSSATVIRAAPKLHTLSDIFSLTADERNNRSKIIPSDVLNKVRKANHVTIDCSTSKHTGVSTFIIKGKADDISKARRELLRDLTVHVTVTVQVPASARPAIIGPKGSNLRPIIAKSGTQIQVAKKEETPVVEDDEEEPVVDITIEGDREGVEIAKKEILAIVSARVRHATMKISNIPSKVYPALAGPDNSQIIALEQGRDVKITVPDHFYVSKNNLQLPIVISGERNTVIETKTHLENLAQTIINSYVSMNRTVTKAHQLFIHPSDVFLKTGVVVSPTGSLEQWELFGPAKQINAANDYVNEAGKNVKMLSLPISKAHDNDVKHSKVLARYFKASGKIDALEKKYNVIISLPKDSVIFDPKTDSISLELVSTDADQITACRKELIGLVNEYTPSRVKVVSDIDPFFFKNLGPKSRHVTDIKTKNYVEVLVPEDAKLTHDIVLVYEGDPSLSEDDFLPGASEIKAHLESASKSLDDIRTSQKDITSEILTVAVEDHKYILGPNGTTLNAILKGVEHDSFVSVHLGNATVPEGYDSTKSAPLTPESVYIRGLSKQVKEVVKEIDQVVDEGRNYEVLSSYTTQFQFPAEHVNKLIGKGGSNLTKIREEFGVKIDVDPEGQGVIKGIKKNAEEAKQRIFNLGRRLADEVTLRLSIPNEYHATLIGTGGKFVRRLEEKYDVRIKFPRSGDNSADEDSRDRPSNADEVVVRGPSRGAAKAKEEILELVQYEKDNSHSDVISVPVKALSRIIGRNGEFINDLKDSTNTRIDVGDHGENAEKDTKVPITVLGTKTGVKQVMEKISEIVKEIEDTVTQEIEVDPKYHRFLIGANGSAMREIITKAGEPFNPRLIQIPQAGSGNNKITLHGRKKTITKIATIIKGIVEERENQVELLVPISVERHGSIIGPGGQIKKVIESECNVSISVPYQGSKNAKGELDRNIKVIGTKENVEKAKVKILEVAADDSKVDVPLEYNNLVFDSGMLIKKLRNDFDVRVDLGRTTFSKDPLSKVPAEAIGETLITDENPANKFKWTLVSEPAAAPGSKTGVITWRFKGSADNCKKAKEVVEKALERSKKYDSTGYLWLADSSKYRLVIGPAGSTINNIRDKSECSVAIPKANAKKEENAIVIRGEKSNVEKAMNMILDVVKRV